MVIIKKKEIPRQILPGQGAIFGNTIVDKRELKNLTAQGDVQAQAQTSQDTTQPTNTIIAPQDVQAQDIPTQSIKNIPPVAQGINKGLPSFAQAAVSSGLLESSLVNNVPALTKKMKDAGLTPEQVTSNPNEQNILNLHLNEIDLQNIKEGKAHVSVFGAAIEAIPISHIKIAHIPISAWIGVTPSGKVKELRDLTIKNSALASTYATAALSNPAAAPVFRKLILDLEQQNVFLESRIKLLSLQSPEIQADPEQVNSIKADVSASKTEIQMAKITAGILG